MRIPDVLSISRIVLTAPIVFAILGGDERLAMTFLCIALATDFLDGWFARRCGATAIGRVLDPLADKILVAGTLAALLANGKVPGEFVGIVILRDVALLAFGWLRWRGAAPIPAASPLGKVAFAALGVWVVGAVGGVVWPAWTAAIVAATYAAAGFGYAAAISAPVGDTAEGKR